ncbi:long-chain fatty acid--CoA ligase [Brevibacterium sp. 50QC2O2]|uniref:AMP-dependent synthetase/ligase n=1 Tax=Brevibacterium sp. 50QC2O2 TaxID=2968459 RepID=UPI002795B0C4|nr:AMP-dependent synthetase/ligase [Brevibacterium sp. 50QC2O2]
MTGWMRQSATPATYSPDDTSTITDCFLRALAADPDAHALSIVHERTEEAITRAEFHADVIAVAKGLVAAGLGPGSRVGIFGPSSYRWAVADFAIWFAGATSIPFYDTASAEQIEWMLADARPALMLVADAGHREVLAGVPAGAGLPVHMWDDEDSLAQLHRAGRSVTDTALDAQRRRVGPQDVATIIYTSGTTGRAKGCLLTHANFVLTAQAASRSMPEVLAPGARCLLFIPTAHVFARFIQVISICEGVVLGHQHDLGRLTESLAVFRPTFVLGVPRVFEKVFNAARAKAQSGGQGRIFTLAEITAVAYSRAADAGRVPWGLRLRHALFDRLVYARLRAVLGGRAEYAISGGGPLGEHLGHFFSGIGVRVLEGYGLTETTAPVTVNRPGASRIGTVGVPLPGCAVAVAGDGEVLVQGPPVFSGYLNNPEATAATFHGDWLATGDLGSLDEEGYLSITGRKKELIVTSGGKNVAPAPLEDVIRRHPLVGQPVVVGEQRKFVGALIFLDPEMLPGWLEAHGLPPLSLDRAAAHPAVRASIQAAVDRANARVSRAEGIRAFRIVPVELTEAAGYLSAKQSVKRPVVLQDFAAELEALYSTPRPA